MRVLVIPPPTTKHASALSVDGTPSLARCRDSYVKNIWLGFLLRLAVAIHHYLSRVILLFEFEFEFESYLNFLLGVLSSTH